MAVYAMRIIAMQITSNTSNTQKYYKEKKLIATWLRYPTWFSTNWKWLKFEELCPIQEELEYNDYWYTVYALNILQSITIQFHNDYDSHIIISSSNLFWVHCRIKSSPNLSHSSLSADHLLQATLTKNPTHLSIRFSVCLAFLYCQRINH